MSLEDDIQQRSFRSPQQKASINLMYTLSWLNSQYAPFFKNSGITSQQYNVLRILRGQNNQACSLKLIKERMLDRMSDASRIVDKLVAKGLIIRKPSEEDRRSVKLLISEKGLELLKKLDYVDDAAITIFSNLSESQISHLSELLDDLRGSKRKNA
jgi:DNA-binding MarR family transcriptional regulator